MSKSFFGPTEAAGKEEKTKTKVEKKEENSNEKE